MGDLASAVIVGRLTRDAELKYTNSGQAVCHFSLATNSRTKKGDQWVDEPNYWDVDLWGKRGESVNQYLTKGKLVAVQGDMRQDRWEQDGQTRMKVRINANDVQLLSAGSSQGASAPYAAESQGPARGSAQSFGQASQSQYGGPQGGPPAPKDDFTDDIPF